MYTERYITNVIVQFVVRDYLNFHSGCFFYELVEFVLGMTAPLVPVTKGDEVVKFNGEGETWNF